MFDELTGRWWTVAARGAVAFGIGIALFFARFESLGLLVSLFGVFALADGAFVLGAGLVVGWLPLLLEGVFGIAVAAFMFLSATAAEFWFVALVASWALVTSGFELVVAARLHRLARGSRRFAGRLLGCLGVVSVLAFVGFGLRPGLGAVTGVVGTYAVLAGLLLLTLALNIRTWRCRPTRPLT